MRIHPFKEDKIDPKKVYDKRILRPKKPSLVKKGFNKIKTWLQSHIEM